MAFIHHDSSWRARLGRDIGWSFLVKLVLLTLLWALFFSSSHQCRVDGLATASRFGLDTNRAEPHTHVTTSGGDRCD
jgi:hypothetical protein